MIDVILRGNIERSIQVQSRILAACLPALIKSAEALISAYKTGRKALFFGNGGSAADARHLAAEFVGPLSQTTIGMSRVSRSLHGN